MTRLARSRLSSGRLSVSRLSGFRLGGLVDLVAPTFNAPTYVDETQTLTIPNLSEGGTLVWATSVTGNTPTYSIAGSPPGTWGGDATHETGSFSGVTTLDEVQLPVTDTTPNGTQNLRVYIYDAAGNLSAPFDVTITVDNTAPVITGVSVTAGNTQLDVDWSTDTGSDTARIVAVPNGDTPPTGPEIMAGQESGGAAADADSGNITVTGTGAQTQVTLTGLTNGTAYDVYLAHEDAYGNIGTASDLNNTPTAGPTLVFGDTFTYSGTVFAQGWTEYFKSSGFPSSDVVSNANNYCEAQLGDQIVMITDAVATDPDQSLKFTFRTPSGANAISAGVRITKSVSPGNYQDVTNGYLISLDDASTPDVSLVKRVGGAFTSIATVSPSHDPTDGDVFEIKAVGSTIKVFINGTEELSVTDTDISGAGDGHGFVGFRRFGGNPRIDNFEFYEGVT